MNVDGGLVSAPGLGEALATKSMVLVCGSGGVGKTTMSAAIGAAADAAGPEAAQGRAVGRAVIEVAGVAHRVGIRPTQTEGPAPAGLGRLPGAAAVNTPGSAEPGAAQQGFQAGEAKARHGAG